MYMYVYVCMYVCMCMCMKIGSADKVLNLWDLKTYQLVTTIPVFEHVYDVSAMTSSTFVKLTGKAPPKLDEETGGIL